MPLGVVCPACVQPQLSAGKSEAQADSMCDLCRGHGLVSVQAEIAWLKRNKVGCYADKWTRG